MKMDIEKINKSVMCWFKKISKIPRGSGNEKAVSDYIENFALNLKGLGITVFHQTGQSGDKQINNVIIKKPGSKGYEKLPPVALQAHIDMVCQKTADSDHDFMKDEIKIITEGDRIHADRTTLGADDGIGVACMMAILESTELKHPPIEAIFTSDEEDGMSGADNLDMNHISAGRLINIDTEEEGKFFYGCAGGRDMQIEVPLTKTTMPDAIVCFSVSVHGLLGGHSGLMIDQKRANANRLMGRALNYLSNRLAKENTELYLFDISGGTARNAITNKATAIVGVKNEYADIFKTEIETVENIFVNEYRFVEHGLKLTAEPTDPKELLPADCASLKRVIKALMMPPNDVIAMHGQVPDLVETSSNMGIVEQKDDVVYVSCFARSCIATKLDMVTEQIRLIAESIGAGFSAEKGSPEWEPNPDSKLKALFEDTYKKEFGKEASTESIHAGLECGYFSKRRPDMDIIAIGPTITGAHTPEETLYASTVKPVVQLLIAALERMDGTENEIVVAPPANTVSECSAGHSHKGHVCAI